MKSPVSPAFWSLVIGYCLFAPSLALAIEFQQTKDYNLPADQELNGQVAVAAETATILGKAQDDVFLLAGEATVKGDLQNDAWIFARSAQVGGTVHDHLRVVALTAIISGTVSNSIVAGGQTIQITRECHVIGSANAAAWENVVMEGTIEGPVRLAADKVTLGGTVHGDARIFANDLVVLPGAVIDGDLVYTSQKDLVLDSKVQLHGKLIHKELEQPSPEMTSVTAKEIIILNFYLLFAALMVGLPFAGLLPRVTGNAVRLIGRSSLKCGLIGMVTFCLLPMVASFAMMTIVGIPLALALFVLYSLGVYISKIVVAIAFGGALMRWRGPQPFSRVMLAMILGLVLLYTLAALPIVGLAVWFLVTFLGLGGLVSGLFESQAAVPPLPPDQNAAA